MTTERTKRNKVMTRDHFNMTNEASFILHSPFLTTDIDFGKIIMHTQIVTTSFRFGHVTLLSACVYAVAVFIPLIIRILTCDQKMPHFEERIEFSD